MNWFSSYLALLSFPQILLQVHGLGQLTDNTPPTMWLERNWQIFDNEPIGSKISQVHGSDAEGGPLIYGLEPHQFFGSKGSPDKLPFRIDPDTGTVYLNESLRGRAGQDLHLYVTIFDGELTAKTEVYVNILNSSSTYKPAQSHPQFPVGQGGVRQPSFLNYPGFNHMSVSLPAIEKNLSINSPQFLANNPPYISKQPYFQQKTYPEGKLPEKVNKTGRISVTQLKPVEIENKEVKNAFSDPSEWQTTTMKVYQGAYPKDLLNNNLVPVNSIMTLAPEVAGTVIPVVSVCAVFITVGIIAVLFRKKIYLGKSKDSKENNMTKGSSSRIVVGEDQSLNMQVWRVPRSFGNRYEPWQRDMTHSEITNQISAPAKNTDRWEFPRHRLKFFNILGEGAFGQVWKCEALDFEGKEAGSTIVAVKTLKENANEKEKSDLISELEVMKKLDPHPNVVKLLGCCTEKEPILVLIEFISQGKLQSYLRNSRAERYYNNMHGHSRSLTSRDLTSFCYQVAKGMEFLSANGIIHRDLAARNILITEERICKVADFGFARDVIASHVYERKSEGRLPIRWMAPESLYDNLFSIKSDVWSFGIFIWEVVTLGSTPYPGMPAAEVMKKVRDGYRLDKPEHCRRELYNIMYYCWGKTSKDRPTFTECVDLLETLLMTETDYIELERFPDHSYYNMISLSGEKL